MRLRKLFIEVKRHKQEQIENIKKIIKILWTCQTEIMRLDIIMQLKSAKEEFNSKNKRSN